MLHQSIVTNTCSTRCSFIYYSLACYIVGDAELQTSIRGAGASRIEQWSVGCSNLGIYLCAIHSGFITSGLRAAKHQGYR